MSVVSNEDTLLAVNVSSLLTTLIQYSDPSIIDQIPSSSPIVSIPNHVWMNISSISTIVDGFSKMEELKIGDYDFECVKEFYLDGKKNLKLIEIGKNSFTSTPNGNGFDEFRSFQITNCPELESIEIGDYSFSDCASTFEIVNCWRLIWIGLGRRTVVNVLRVRIEGMCRILYSV